MSTAAGVPRRAVALRLAPAIFGALAAIAFPPFGFLPGLLGYGLLMRSLDAAAPHAPLRSAFWRGWLGGFFFFLIATWWVFEAFQVDAANQGWMAPFAVALLAAGLGLFWGIGGLAYRWIGPKGPARALVFAGVFCLAEWLRGHLLTGFPWDLPGEAWRAGSAPSQAASVFGAYGLSLITVAAAAALCLVLDRDDRRASRLAAGIGALVVIALYGLGDARLAHPAPADPTAPVVRVVQPNEPEQPSYDLAALHAIVDRYAALTARPPAPGKPWPQVIVWPEGAIPDSANDYLAPDSWTRAELETALRPGQSLLDGAYRIQPSVGGPLYFNTLIALRQTAGGLVQTGAYDKYRLVPFGEYMPLDGLMARLGVKKLVHVGDGFSSGPRSSPIAPDGVPRLQALICYESLFPGLARESPGGRARWIVNVSDDAWFGRTYGPLQHLNLASYRAIEEGLPIVRATPTGVSAVVDAYGRVVPGALLGQGAMGVIDAALPPALPPTVFSRFGESPFWILTLLSLAVTFIDRRRVARAS